jgi:hypothetical protein
MTTEKTDVKVGFRTSTAKRLEQYMINNKIPKEKQSETIDKLVIRSLNEKHTQDYMPHFGYLANDTECLKCHKMLKARTWAVIGNAMAICEECHSERWSTPAIQRREQKKLELDHGIKCLTMDCIAKSNELAELYIQITGTKAQVEWNKLESVLGEAINKLGTPEQQEFFEGLARARL